MSMPPKMFALIFALLPTILAQDEPHDRCYDALSEQRALHHIRFLASDVLEGRATGSGGELAAASYIAATLEACQLEAMGDDGGWFQRCELTLDESTTVHSQNVAGLLRGSDPDEVVVLAAHYDHLGRGPYGSLAESDAQGQIHPGADDNASGVAACLELARVLVESGWQPRRSVLFLFFSGEERGNLGSEYYTAHPLVPLPQTVAMLNLDMVGRGQVGAFQVWGVGTAPDFAAQLKSVEVEVERRSGTELEPYYGAEDPGAGDNNAFHKQGIPSLLFHTGGHGDYHTPGDTWQEVEPAQLSALMRFALLSLIEITDADERLESPPARP